MSVEENLRLFQTLDDAWNSKDSETFKQRHAENVAVYWPGQPEPTRGRQAHHAESVEFFKAFDNRLDTHRTGSFSVMATTPAQWPDGQAPT